MPRRSTPHHLFSDPEAALAEALENAPCFTAITAGITVSVHVFWLDDQSQPENHRYAWAYHIRIANGSEDTVQLVSRSWEIMDGRGQKEHVHGDGVVGEQPVIPAGDHFDYTSGAALDTSTGFMRGTYHMLNPATNARFDIEIPAFSLDSPHHGGIMH